MKLCDSVIQETLAAFKGCRKAVYPFDPTRAWADAGVSRLVLQRDAACELGGLGSVNFTCITTSEDLVPEDCIEVYGKELSEVRGPCAFARIALVLVSELGEEPYDAIRDTEYVRYRVFPKGYMVRVSAETNQEAVRISREAAGISFDRVGNTYLARYHALPFVRRVRLLFAVDPPDLPGLIAKANRVDAITNTLNHILDGLPTDCGHCSLKPVCDEVEGMRELHQHRAAGK